tara:strand:- start:123 stop:1394 length:1272 start_codon:yes stop_codon:yes gene_type:complete
MFEVNSILKRRKFLQTTRKQKIDIFLSPVLIIPSILVLISSLLIFSIQKESIYNDSLKHILTGLIGYFIAVTIAFIPMEKIKNYIIPMYFLSLTSLIMIYFFGISTYGAQRWLNVGVLTFQPSEIAKMTTVFALAGILERKSINSIQDLFFPSLIVVLPWTLIFIQPDLGTSLVLIFSFLVMLYWVQMPIEWIFILICSLITAIFSFANKYFLIFWIPLMGYLAFRSFKFKKISIFLVMSFHGLVAHISPFLWNTGLKQYQKDRLILFLDPGRDPLGGGYHLLQSKIGIGSGGLFGTGILNGKLTNLQFIPEQHTDFIFSAAGEEMGFLGTTLIVFLFLILIFKLLIIAKNARTDFESLLVIGIASIFLFQIIINIYMTIGLGPVTGIPLPFMSYGRTSLLVNFIFIGVSLSTYKRSISLRNK